MKDLNNLEYYDSIFSKNDLEKMYEESGNKDLLDFPVIYLLKNNKKIYIGETSSLKTRMNNHLKDSKKKIFKDMKVIFYPEFNKSATYNIETNLIHYISADKKGLITTNESQIKTKETHNYYDKEYFDKNVFKRIWKDLQADNIVEEDLEIIQDKDIFKISPFTSLTAEQMDLRETILKFCVKNRDSKNGAVLLVNGEAGTGKSVLLSSAFKKIMDESKNKNSKLYGFTNNFLLVHHEEMIKTYKNIARVIPSFKVNQFLKPTTFVNSRDKLKNNGLEEKADIVFVDEAHLLLTRSDNYNYFSYTNHLEEIIKRSKVTIVIFDDKQVLKAKSYWDKNSIKKIMKGKVFEEYPLEQQMRMNASGKTIE